MNKHILSLLGLSQVNSLKMSGHNLAQRAPPLERVINDLSDELDDLLPSNKVPKEIEELQDLHPDFDPYAEEEDQKKSPAEAAAYEEILSSLN